jgi:hypothetical protein
VKNRRKRSKIRLFFYADNREKTEKRIKNTAFYTHFYIKMSENKQKSTRFGGKKT